MKKQGTGQVMKNARTSRPATPVIKTVNIHLSKAISPFTSVRSKSTSFFKSLRSSSNRASSEQAQQLPVPVRATF